MFRSFRPLRTNQRYPRRSTGWVTALIGAKPRSQPASSTLQPAAVSSPHQPMLSSKPPVGLEGGAPEEDVAALEVGRRPFNDVQDVPVGRPVVHAQRVELGRQPRAALHDAERRVARRCASPASSQPGRGVTSSSRKAISGARALRQPKLRAAAGP